MKKTIRNLFISFFYYSGVVFVYQKLQRRRGPLVRVVSFHDVRNREWFEALIDLIFKKYHVLSVSDFEQKKFHNQKVNILFTFDDGYQSWIDVVLPVFKKFHIQGVFFACSGALEVAGTEREQTFVRNNLLLNTERKLLTWQGLKTLHDEGQVIGGHTVTHKRLSTLPADEAEREVADDKQRLEMFLSTKLHHFAYPFGAKTDTAQQIHATLLSQNYHHVHVAFPGWYNGNTDIIPRLLLEEGQSAHSVKCWIAGGYDLFYAIS